MDQNAVPRVVVGAVPPVARLAVARAVLRVVQLEARHAGRHAADYVSAQTAQKVQMVVAKDLYLSQLLRGSARASQLRQA